MAHKTQPHLLPLSSPRFVRSAHRIYLTAALGRGQAPHIAERAGVACCLHAESTLWRRDGPAYGGAPRLSCHERFQLPGLPVTENFGFSLSFSIIFCSSCMIVHDWSGRFGDL